MDPSQGTNARAARVDAGKCIYCDEPSEGGRLRCAAHGMEHRERTAAIRAAKTAAGECWACSGAAAAGKNHCAKHLRKKITENGRRAKMKAKSGRCRRCTAHIPSGSPRKCCDACALKDSLRSCPVPASGVRKPMWPLEDIVRLGQMCREMATLAEIAAALGRSKDAVRNKIAAMELPAPARPVRVKLNVAEYATARRAV